jgi:diguanylate cyclase (GGDEF)-like protein
VRIRIITQNHRLLRSRQVLADAVEHLDLGVILIDEKRQMPVINRRAVELLDIPAWLLIDMPSYDKLVQWQLDSAEFGHGSETEKRFRAHAKMSRFDLQDTLYERTRPDGRVLEIRTQVLASGSAVRTYTDITERKCSEARIGHMAHHDALTGLANRPLLHDRLSQAMNHAMRNQAAVAVLALDLNRFKEINDGFGHAAGDGLLVLVGQRLQAALRSADTLARVGGDEFVVVQTDVGQPMAASELCSRLIEVLAEPFELDGHQVRIGTSIGVALYPADGATSAELLRNADTALYLAKAEGRGTFRFFEARMDQRLHERRTLEYDLRQAIGTNQLHLYFQPVMSVATDAVMAFEALLRWRHPVRGDVSPDEFIPVAEESGLILPIGAWVLEQACQAAASWDQPRRIAVNLSAAQLRCGDLCTQVAGVLLRTGLPARLLELEVTETMLISNPKQVLHTLRELQKMGVAIACDDFGTGYSSFSYLQNLAFDRIKIDKSFIHALGVNPAALRIVQAILAMAKSLGMEVTAEGVEIEWQLALLRELRCGEVQGFLLGRPMPGDEISRCLLYAPLARSEPLAAD